VGVDEELGVFGIFDQAEVSVEEVCEEQSEIFDELLVLVVRGRVRRGDV
jgi:hypothetical protein